MSVDENLVVYNLMKTYIAAGKKILVTVKSLSL